MGDSPVVWTGKSTGEKAQEAIDAVQDALFDTLGPVPLPVALGVLRLVEYDLIQRHGESDD